MIGEETLMATEHWVDDSSVPSVATSGTIDAYCNLATLMFAKITNLMAEIREKPGSVADRASKSATLWRELQEWRECRPREALPLRRTDTLQKSPFQTILYTHSSSSMIKMTMCLIWYLLLVVVCGNTFYHAGSILLLETGNVCEGKSETDINEVSVFFVWYHCLVLTLKLLYDPVWHAKELGGISTSNASQ